MSIYAYTGRPGSGKSYNVVANVILPALRDGRRVVTNIPLYTDVIMGAEGVRGELVKFPIDEVKQDPELILKYVQPGDVFVVDEVYKLWPSGDKTSMIPDVYKSLLAEHRHMTDAQGRSIHIVLAVQELGSVAVFARKLVEQTFIHTKLGDMGLDGRYRVDIYQGAVTGFKGSDKDFIRSVHGEYVKEVWQFYQSHTKAVGVSGGIGGEKAIDSRGNRFKRPFFLAAGLFIPIAIVCVVIRFKHEEARLMHPDPPPGVVRSENHAGFFDTTRESVGRGVLSGVVGSVSKTVSFRVLGYIEVPGRPERSKAILISDAGQKITRSMTRCRFIDGDYFECEVEGVWYGSVGKSLVADDGRSVPVSLPVGPHLELPVVGPQPAAAVSRDGAAPTLGASQAAPPVSLSGVVTAPSS